MKASLLDGWNVVTYRVNEMASVLYMVILNRYLAVNRWFLIKAEVAFQDLH